MLCVQQAFLASAKCNAILLSANRATQHNQLATLLLQQSLVCAANILLQYNAGQRI